MNTGSSDHVRYTSHYIQYLFVFLLNLASSLPLIIVLSYYLVFTMIYEILPEV